MRSEFTHTHTHTHTHTQFAFAYIFNLIVGVGALALPRAFSEAGLILGTILIVILAFMSFMTASYILEAMAAANAYEKLQKSEKIVHNNILTNSDSKLKRLSESADETAPLIPHTTPSGKLGIVEVVSHSVGILYM